MLPLPKALNGHAKRIDHLAIAVRDLDAAIEHYRSVLGLSLVERRETQGRTTAMRSAVMQDGELTMVLLEGCGEDSQVSRYIEEYGPGVHHIAIEVDGVARTVEALSRKGMRFSTGVIRGDGLEQAFTERDQVSGAMFELIERTGETVGFQDDNVQGLFEALEARGAF